MVVWAFDLFSIALLPAYINSIRTTFPDHTNSPPYLFEDINLSTIDIIHTHQHVLSQKHGAPWLTEPNLFPPHASSWLHGTPSPALGLDCGTQSMQYGTEGTLLAKQTRDEPDPIFLCDPFGAMKSVWTAQFDPKFGVGVIGAEHLAPLT